MKSKVLFLSAAILAAGACVALLGLGSSAVKAQDEANYPRPDPSHILVTLMSEAKWVGKPGASQAHWDVVGDTRKDGLYVRVAKWNPHNFSQPHYHNNIRYMIVISGTWWVSSGTVFDESKMFPIRPGTIVVDEPNKSHFDGAKDEPAVLVEVGFGPLTEPNCDGRPGVNPGVGSGPNVACVAGAGL